MKLNVTEQGDKSTKFFTESGSLFAEGYRRIVIGGRGPYLEFPQEYIKAELIVPDRQLWRLEDEWQDKIYYWWFETKVDGVKVYYQRKVVTYADYLVDFAYVDPYNLYIANGKGV